MIHRRRKPRLRALAGQMPLQMLFWAAISRLTNAMAKA